MNQAKVIGWDVGGAHLKMAIVDHAGNVLEAEQWPTPLWQGFDSLIAALKDAHRFWPNMEVTPHAVTTTAELVDLFKDRQEGIRQIVRHMQQGLGSKRLGFYTAERGFAGMDEAIRYSEQVASANWHATASYVAQHLKDAVMIDIGSTTTDVIPIRDNRVCHEGFSDHERLKTRELVYTGIIRTPLMALARAVPLQGDWCPIVAEHFATTADIYRITGELDEADDMMAAADNGEKSVAGSLRRLARMVGRDLDSNLDPDDMRHLVLYIARRQQQLIDDALDTCLSRVVMNKATLVGAGCGRFLVRKLAKLKGLAYIDFEGLINVSEEKSVSASRCATAVSVAMIARDKI